MATPYVHGAVGLFVQLQGMGNPGFLGTCERAPRRTRRRRWAEVRNDLAGEESYDVSYQGSACYVTAKLTRWNEAVLLALENAPAPAVGLDTAGVEPVGAIGTLMMTQGAGVQLWVVHDYGSQGRAPQVAFTGQNMRAGDHYYCAFLEGPDEQEGGTDPASEMLTFRCIRSYNATTGAFTLYDHNVTACQGIVWN